MMGKEVDEEKEEILCRREGMRTVSIASQATTLGHIQTSTVPSMQIPRLAIGRYRE
jgi:hypothetical protein